MRSGFLFYVALCVATLAVYAPVARFDFVNFDDPDYVTQNSHVRSGLTPANIVWAFSSTKAANWFPLTWLSHMLDCQLFGLNSGLHHLTNLLLHTLATLLLFAFLQRATRAPWSSAFVAFVFALHPLHVESVAWVAERKDVLSALFWFLTLWAYARYTERPGKARYWGTVVSFALALMAKPMAVTLPFVLLLIDIWPLRRLTTLGWRKGLWEKLPFFGLSTIVSVLTYLVQQENGAVQVLSRFPFGLRMANALVSYATYAGKMFWPSRLAVFYPYTRQIAIWQVAIGAGLILGVSVLVLGFIRTLPYLAVGWLWYLGTLAPVIGLVQVGAQARADRYTYLPIIGLSIMLAWGVADLLKRWPRMRRIAIGLAAASCSCCFALTSIQLQHWRDSESLFRHALDVTENNYIAEHNLGIALSENPGKLPEAITHLQAAVRIEPHSARVHTDLGNALANTPGQLDAAVEEYRAALRLAPDSAITHNDLGNTLLRMPGRLPEAISQYRTALHLYPDYAEAHNNLGSALAQSPGQLPEAISEYEAALRIWPDYDEARTNLNTALANDPQRLPEAIAQDQAAVEREPASAEAHANLASALEKLPGGLPKAIAEYEAALRINPDYAEVHYNLGVALARSEDRLVEAIRQYQMALKLKPNYPDAENNLGVAYSQIPGQLPDAIGHFRAALRMRPEFADAEYNLGIALFNLPGQTPEAIQHLETAVRLKPDAQSQQMLERMRAAQASHQ